MRAAVFKGAGQPLAIETLDDPKPGPGEVILKVHRCGICGTDLHLTSGHAFDFQPGTVLGHEYSGEIVEVGSGVEGFRTGDIITAVPSVGCGHCAACAEGNPVLCHETKPVFGGYGEYLRAPASAAVKLPSTLSLADGALVEPLAVSLHALRLATMRPGDKVLVLGGGAVALTTIYWARRLGAGRIVAASRSERRAALALEMGADAFVQSGDAEVAEVSEALGGSPDIVFECVGVPGIIQKAIAHVRTYGQVLSLGFCIDPDTIMPAMAALKAVKLGFPVGYALRDFQYSAETLHAGRVDPARMISSTVSLEQLPATFEMLRGPNTETKVHVALS
ncbi:alcohol dehydrogenase catalytic domain-containing protein [Phenylobacterium sp. LjRoot225]|uniref:alcohol dehydrogenase catalytic domain-containing protein n=1 Tax=Phenylobacterium sp. LjRoot225 TaxID=3342285 RepID=UPI003ECF5E8E